MSAPTLAPDHTCTRPPYSYSWPWFADSLHVSVNDDLNRLPSWQDLRSSQMFMRLWTFSRRLAQLRLILEKTGTEQFRRSVYSNPEHLGYEINIYQTTWNWRSVTWTKYLLKTLKTPAPLSIRTPTTAAWPLRPGRGPGPGSPARVYRFDDVFSFGIFNSLIALMDDCVSSIGELLFILVFPSQCFLLFVASSVCWLPLRLINGLIG